MKKIRDGGVCGGCGSAGVACGISLVFIAVAVFGSGAAFPQEAPPGKLGEVWPEHAAEDEDVGKGGRILLPFTRDQIRSLARLLEQTRKATAVASGRAVKGRLRRLRIDADTIPAISVRRGYTTVVGFTDVTGAPWPIEEVLVDSRFLPGEGSAPSGHLLYLSPVQPFLEGNLVVKLAGMDDAVVAMLKGGSDRADFRVDLRLGLAGPNVDPSVLAKPEAFSAGDEVLAGVLTGSVPAEAERLRIVGGRIGDRAWRVGGDILLVSRAHVLSPGPWAAERGAAGRWAYRLPDTPFVLVSDGGREVRLGFEEEGGPELDAGGRRR